MKRAVALLLVAGACTVAGAQPLLSTQEVDLVRILPPPPADDSAQTRSELAELLSIQASRSAAMEARARDDSEETVWRFAATLGPKFRKESLPLVNALFERVAATEGAIVDPAKAQWKRPRPYQLSEQVKPVLKLSKSGSYPSGHATLGTLIGIILADMVPEKRSEIMARASEYGFNRVVGGVHYRSDIEAGRVAGSVIAQALFMREDLRAELDAARKELRAVLGLAVPAAPASSALGGKRRTARVAAEALSSALREHDHASVPLNSDAWKHLRLRAAGLDS